MDAQSIKKAVKTSYGKIANGQTGCGCGCSCGDEAQHFAQGIGYSTEELALIPETANLGLSCGNPTAIAGLKAGETVLDLGSGAGFDCFLAAAQVGHTGKVFGVDMTPEMIQKATENATKNNISNVEFRLGDIENLPIDTGTIDVIISNCVINLATDKAQVFSEIYRVLKPGGRIAISDIVLKKPLSPELADDADAYIGCISGAILKDDYLAMLTAAGFSQLEVIQKSSSSCTGALTTDLKNGETFEDYIVSITVGGCK